MRRIVGLLLAGALVVGVVGTPGLATAKEVAGGGGGRVRTEKRYSFFPSHPEGQIYKCFWIMVGGLWYVRCYPETDF